MITLKHILVASDFSEASEAALDYGREFARTFGATLHVAHVVENLFATVGGEFGASEIASLRQQVEDAARDKLEAVVAEEGPARAERPAGPVDVVERRARDRRLCQRRKDRPHPDRHARTRGVFKAPHGQCGREGRANCALSGPDGPTSRARVHPPGRSSSRRPAERVTLPADRLALGLLLEPPL